MEAFEERMAQRLGERQALFMKQFVRYFGVALVGLAVDFGVMVFLHEVAGLYYLYSAIAGFLAGLTVNYVLSTRYVFKDSKLNSKWMEFVSFAVIGLIGLGLLSVSMWILTDGLHVHYVVSKVLATVVVFIWNFLGRKALYRN